MKYGEAKWILYPIGVKVRNLITETENDVEQYFNEYNVLIDNDFSGVKSIHCMVIDLNYVTYSDNVMTDVVNWKVEPLDPEWKSEYLDQVRETYGRPDHYFEWYCERESAESQKEKDEWCENKISQLKASGTQYTDKGLVEEFCKSTGRGSVIPLFLLEFQTEVKWIESHIVQKVESKTKRGTNPNSLKNLVQNRDKQGVTS